MIVWTKENIYTLVEAALAGILIAPLVVMSIVSLCSNWRPSDPARTGFNWMKVVCFFEILFMILVVISDILFIEFSDPPGALQLIIFCIGRVGYLLGRIASVLMIVTFAEVANGFFLVTMGTKANPCKPLFLTSLAIASVLFIIALGYFSKQMASLKYYKAKDALGESQKDLAILYKLRTAWDILNWLVSLLLLGLGGIVFIVSRSHRMLQNSCRTFLAATILWFAKWLFTMVYDIIYVLNTSPDDDKYLIVSYVLSPTFEIWTFFTVLVLIFIIGHRKKTGLWSAAKPELGVTDPIGAAPPMPGGQYGLATPRVVSQQPQGHMQQQPRDYVPQPVQEFWQPKS